MRRTVCAAAPCDVEDEIGDGDVKQELELPALAASPSTRAIAGSFVHRALHLWMTSIKFRRGAGRAEWRECCISPHQYRAMWITLKAA